jgi:hypothetical protein
MLVQQTALVVNYYYYYYYYYYVLFAPTPIGLFGPSAGGLHKEKRCIKQQRVLSLQIAPNTIRRHRGKWI